MSSDEMRHKLTDHMLITDHGKMDRWMLVSQDSSVSVQLTAGTARKTSMAWVAIHVIRMISGTGTWLGMNHSTEICSYQTLKAAVAVKDGDKEKKKKPPHPRLCRPKDITQVKT